MPAKYCLIFSLLLSPPLLCAGEGLLFLEVQAVAGYASMQKGAVYHSMSADEPMQKSSVGFDLLHKYSGAAGDKGMLAVQGRLAWDPDAQNRLEPQIYNAYYRFKTPYAYFWSGHNRVAAGLESYFDSHSALLQTLPMYGYGFDRDWGIGASHDYSWGDMALSMTTGTGMRPRAAGNYLVSGRLTSGVLNHDNYTAGFYSSWGRIPEVSGYRVLDATEKLYSAVGADYTLLWDRWELRADLRSGIMRREHYTAGLGRLGLNLTAENRIRLELQVVYSAVEKMRHWIPGTAVSCSVTAQLTLRALFEYDSRMNDKRAVAQIYYYLPV